MNRSSNRLLVRVAAAHSVSHVHIMTVPAMLPLLPGAMGVGFVDLGVAIGVFNGVSALAQAPLGFVVDRLGAKPMLMTALALGTLSYLLLAIYPAYFCLLVSMAVAGFANGIYHPADYSLLSRGIEADRMGRAFSLHTCAGSLGGALTPPIMVGVAVAWGVQWSFAVAAIAGMLSLSFLAFGDRQAASAAAAPARPAPGKGNSAAAVPVAAIAVLTFLFMLLSLSTGSVERFSVSALMQGFDVPLATANTALTAYMFSVAGGVLTGGVLADRTSRHGLLAGGAFALAALLVVAIIWLPLPPLALVVTLAAVGFLVGIVAPSRDMLVRAASPVGAEGRTFGIVSTGFNIGGVAGPVLFGYLIDNGQAAGVLWATVAFMSVTAFIVLLQERHTMARRSVAAGGGA